MRLLAVAWAVGLCVLAGCGGKAGGKAADEGGVMSAARPRACLSGSFRRVGSAKVAFAAVVRSHATVSRRPGAVAFARFGKLNVNRVPTVFSIRGARIDARCTPRWYLVQIAMRPNGVTGWIPASQVSVATVKTRIVVDLSEKRVTLYRGDGGNRRPGHSDADRALLRQPAAHPLRLGRPVRAGSGRRLCILERPDRLDAGRPDRHPRHQRALVDRQGCLERLYPDPE